MLTEDYLMRWIRLVTAAIARAMGLRAQLLYTDAIFVLDQSMETLTGISPRIVNTLDEPSVISMLTGPHGLDTDRLALLASLIKEQADIYAEMSLETESGWRYQRALNFYLEVMAQGGPLRTEPPTSQIIELYQLCAPQLTPTTLLQAFHFFQANREFLQAEDAVSRMLAMANGDPEFTGLAWRFYHGLLRLSDNELNKHHFTRDEVQSRLNSIPPQSWS